MSSALPASIRLVALDRVDSTNTEAMRRHSAGAPSGTLVWARTQYRGRARRGGVWESPPGNLYASLLLRPGRPRHEWAQASFVAAVAVAQAIAAVAPKMTLRLKWPNDVLGPGGKIAGILPEAVPDGTALVIGAGVNVAVHPPGATSLSAEGTRVAVWEVLAAFAAKMVRWSALWDAKGFAPVRKAWLAQAAGVGSAIEVRTPTETLRGTFRALDPQGALVLGGSEPPRRIAAGEVFLLVGAA